MSVAYDMEVLTLFPRMIQAPVAESLLGKAQEQGLCRVRAVDVRDYAIDKHRMTDDAPYGGGAGMVMKPEPLVAAIEAARARSPSSKVFLLSPQGRRLDQAFVEELASLPGLVLVCGRYEGVDERVTEFVDGEISVGDFILSGGEFAALTVIDAVVRLIPGVLGNEASVVTESFHEGLLEYPQYTRPADFRGRRVPSVLLSGNHAEVANWRAEQARLRTALRRPDLLPPRDVTHPRPSTAASSGHCLGEDQVTDSIHHP